ncbi:hypothetical protein [Acinetobacter sp. YH12134]|uniref:hypothetical protein n=1 Tax=Acinetobacter sp. YH12134 TaxID=2601118 RepID=UPI0015D151AE|nr:hypothetical protein [Acinetobacter sp. YH12134]
MSLELRPTVIIDVPLITKEILLNTEQIIIKFPQGEIADIGSLCYLKTAKNRQRGIKDTHLGRLVERESLIDSRRNQIRKLIKIISDQLNFSNKNSITIKNSVDTFISFIRWSDQNKFDNVLEDYENSMKIFKCYSEFLNNNYSKGDISFKHSNTQQARVLNLLSIFFKKNTFNHETRNLKTINFSQNSKSKADKSDSGSINYEFRPIKTINLPLEENTVLLKPEESIITFSDGASLDIGFLCYLRAEPLKYKNKNITTDPKRGRRVQLKSLSKTRTGQVKKLIYLISHQIKLNTLSIKTIHNYCFRFISFMRWADENKFYQVLDCSVSADNTLIFYAEYLSSKFSNQEISLKHATSQLLIVMNILSTFFDGNNFRHKANSLKVSDFKKKLSPHSPVIMKPSIKYEIRPTKLVDFPIKKDEALLNPEEVIIKFSNGRSVDIGALCYLITEPQKDYKQGTSRFYKHGRLVQLQSLSLNRKDQIKRLITIFSDQLSYSGLRVETIIDSVTRFISFMRWADESHLHDVLDSSDRAHKNLKVYSQFLRDKYLRNEISLKHVERQISLAIKVLSDFFGKDNFGHGLFVFKSKSNISKATKPPCEHAQKRLLALCTSLFTGIGSLVLDQKNYPYKLKLPEFLNLPNNFIWLFPAETWFKHPEIALQPRKTCLGFNYLTGELNTLDEIARLRGLSLRGDEQIRLDAQRNIDVANSDFRDSQRMHVGTVALNAFIVIFLAQTGMNWSQLINLTWSNNYQTDSERQLFRTIKWRAGGKECFFELPSSFIPTFKRYLQLRDFLLGDQPCEWLFFTLGSRGLGQPSQIRSSLHNFFKFLKKIDPNLTEIHSRQWRAAKSDWLIRNTDVSTTALVLQNSEKTVLASYIAGSETRHQEEMSNFLNQVSNAVQEKRDKTQNITIRAVGNCSSLGEPKAINNKIPIASNCVEPEGCLFCDKFKIHADEIDIRKLLSCRYCVKKIAHLNRDQETHKNLIQPILDRIDIFITEIKKHNNDLLEKIRYEVDEEGELDNYWRRKFEMLIELGVVI